MDAVRAYEEVIKDNIEYAYLIQDKNIDRGMLDEIYGIYGDLTEYLQNSHKENSTTDFKFVLYFKLNRNDISKNKQMNSFI